MPAYLKILPAVSGDAMILHWEHEEKKYNIFIDGGFLDTYSVSIKPELRTLIKHQEIVDLWVITHLDADHINGAVAFFRDEQMLALQPLKECWFNFFDRFTLAPQGTKTAVSKGIELRDKLRTHGISCPASVTAGHSLDIGGVKIRVLSPDQETYDALAKVWAVEEEAYHRARRPQKMAARAYDFEQPIGKLISRPDPKENKGDVVNRSSIALWIELQGKNLLFLGDAHPSVVIAELEKIRVEKGVERLPVTWIKLAHHASRHNFSGALLDVIDADNFIISSNGNNTACLPNKETLAKILTHHGRNRNDQVRFFFNYANRNLGTMFKVDRREAGPLNFECLFPPRGENGLTITLD